MKSFYSIVLLSIVVASCKVNGDDEAKKFGITGLVTNVTNRPVGNATVSVASKTTITDGAGNYSLQDVPAGSQTITITASGYTTSVSTLDLQANATSNVTMKGTSKVTGTVINSQTGAGVGSAKVSFFTAASAPAAGEGDLVTTTTSSGEFTINEAPTGSFSGRIELASYYNRTLDQTNFSSTTVTIPIQILVAKVSASGKLRAVAFWGTTPVELDVHVTGPISGSGTRFHCYYSNLSPNATIALDHDAQNGGPESVTFESLVAGTYRLSVFNYSTQGLTGASEIFSSPGVVELYDFNGLVQKWTAPSSGSGSGNNWRVFQIVVASPTSYSPSTLGNYTLITNESDVNQFRVGGVKAPLRFNDADF